LALVPLRLAHDPENSRAQRGQAALVGPPPDTKHRRGDLTPPIECIGPRQAVGNASGKPYLADRGFNGQRWLTRWRSADHATVLSAPPDTVAQPWPPHVQPQLASWRQVIETVFGVLTEVFGLMRVDALS
jgi:hypothetical protein